MTYCVGVTGGIGSGKSAVTDRLAALGITVVDADVAAREIVAPGQPALDEIREHFGPGVIQADGNLDRAQLRKIVFENPKQRKQLEAITHPRIRDQLASQLNSATSPYVILASPLLLESGQNSFADHVVVVDVPESVQLERTMARDNNDAALVEKIMAAQLPRPERLANADTVIDNSGTLEALDEQVVQLHQTLLRLAQQSPQ
ncbi:dephospho-CoA kinase [Luminiphilus syltensis NOR5-1B]|uniref:Dephospho-CoA kinase n=1 Tax=Luminiphilus syltensis NOR5-1B TaxID=565045 RepID=B8KR40_9GAMM|nr:dephospho-CoA kinase [Luminiphilus syltensis]EED36370.1 dephospho-CoA kinase [Luminiphilus syltensis NOR5-1B]